MYTRILVPVDGSATSARGLHAEAQRWRADLTVIGTHGQRGFGRMFLGSDAEQILESPSVT